MLFPRSYGISYVLITVWLDHLIHCFTWLVCFLFNQFTPNYYKNYREQTDDTHNVELAKHLVTLEERLKQNSFFSGTDEPNAVDFLIWPWFERIEAVQTLRPGTFVVYCKTSRYIVHAVLHLANGW